MSRATRTLAARLAGPLLVGLALLGAPPPAAATIVVHLPLPELTAEADVVAVATVTGSASRWSDDGRRIVTEVSLAVDDGLKGCAAGDTLVLRTPGGAVDGLAQTVAGVPAFVAGERVLVFLDPTGADGALGLIGLGQGKYTLARTAASPDVDLAIPALDGLTFARVELVADPQAPGGVRRVVEALDVAVDAEPLPAIDLIEQVRALVDAAR